MLLECVAEKNECPLFTISCGDLGTNPQELETRLKEVFQYAVTWKAILLLDEADIFLQERDMYDVKRNALVSIFLRELDYFEGILFVSLLFLTDEIVADQLHSLARIDQERSTKPSSPGYMSPSA